ncbi:MAG: PD-(D/E)XK nuclease family protein [Gemmatimonadetes bacterium]|nr:MAG: PD-(D/E)XK nuclease family protein [Gemmatimonadota bacterium]
MSLIPDQFQFSQSCLTLFDQCPRKFYLRDVKKLAWPAPVTHQLTEQDAKIRRGQAFHQLVYQEALGLEVSPLLQQDEKLKQWWVNYTVTPPDLPAGEHLSEVELSVPFEGYRLTAKYDRLIFTPSGEAVIVDWKTSESPPKYNQLKESWQTAVYCYVLAEGSQHLYGETAISPAQISFVYWYAEYPAQPVVIAYHETFHQHVKAKLQNAIQKITQLRTEADFTKTEKKDKECPQCQYRSYCRQGEVGHGIDVEDDIETIDFIALAEIEF